MCSGSFKNVIYKLFLQIIERNSLSVDDNIYIYIYIYIYILEDLVLNNLL